MRQFLLGAALVLMACGCATTKDVAKAIPGTPPANRQAVAELLEKVARGIEEKKVYNVLAHVSQQYRDEAGRDYPAVQQALKAFLEAHGQIRLSRTNPRLQLHGTTATAYESIGLIADPLDPQAPPVNWFGEVTISLEKPLGANWQITKVSAREAEAAAL